MILSEEQIEQYFREGYVVARGLIPRQRLQPIQEKAHGLITDEANYQPHIFDRNNIEANDPVTHALFFDENVIEAVEQIFDGSVRAYYGFLALLPPRRGKGLPWHQDNQYTQFHGLALNTFIAVNDIEPEMGQLWIAPGSHKRGTLPAQSADEEIGVHHRTIDFEPESSFCLPSFAAGDAVIFDRNTLHRSLKNETDKIRICYAAQYVAQHARQTETGKRALESTPARQLREKMLQL